MTTVDTADQALRAIGALAVILSALASLLPREWRVTQWCARVALALPNRYVMAPAPGLAPRPPVLPVLFMALALSGCSMSLRSARALTVPPQSAEVCDAIDREHSIATTLAGALGGLAGAGGLSSIPVTDSDARGALQGAAAASGIGAAAMGVWSQDRAERFERVCR